MKTVKVVAAVICDSIEEKNKIFATARGYGDYKGGWEFPGGKVEAGETAEQAVLVAAAGNIRQGSGAYCGCFERICGRGACDVRAAGGIFAKWHKFKAK